MLFCFKFRVNYCNFLLSEASLLAKYQLAFEIKWVSNFFMLHPFPVKNKVLITGLKKHLWFITKIKFDFKSCSKCCLGYSRVVLWGACVLLHWIICLLFQTAQYLKNLFSSYHLYDKALVCCYFPSVIYQVTPLSYTD